MRKTKQTQKMHKKTNRNTKSAKTKVTRKTMKVTKVKSVAKKVQKKPMRKKSSALKHVKPTRKTVLVTKKSGQKKSKIASKRVSVATRTKQKKQLTPASLYTNDLKSLSNGFWGNLDLLCFQQIKLEDATADIVYASDDVGVIVKVLSYPGKWQVNTSSGNWKNDKKQVISPVTELKKLCSLIKKSEPNSKLIPAIILMRGTIQDEAIVQAYLKGKAIQLIRADSFKQSHLPTLSKLLASNFSPIMTSIGIDESWDEEIYNTPVEKSVSHSTPRKRHFFTQKQTQKLASFIATVAHAGYFPIASGTIGSLIALPIAYILNQTNLIAFWISILITIWAGVWAIKHFTENKVEKDPSSVIIDEVVGQSISFAFVASGLLHWPMLLIGFILFRFFDICKFGLVKYFDKQKDAWGVMMDDVVAGLQTAFILVLLQILYVLT